LGKHTCASRHPTPRGWSKGGGTPGSLYAAAYRELAWWVHVLERLLQPLAGFSCSSAKRRQTKQGIWVLTWSDHRGPLGHAPGYPVIAGALRFHSSAG
jgi:hypothetical protein